VKENQIELRLLRIEKLLLSNKTVLTFNETAEYTGLSKSYLYKLTSAGMIPHSKPNGKQVYFDKTELDKWLLRNTVRTNEEMNATAATYVVTNKTHKL
jgi:excisionase family DNA binding protein